ncbi:MAG: DUF1376 domain-containing protein [Aliihoeflea sp.]|uniref:DUF1376 domain-containing protein n=1 Tax=Aliihoeflea sp. TaxID=2608088 RepID=UPI004034F678
MTHLPFIQQSCGDVIAETAHLSTAEFGAYQLLAFAFWQHGALPDDDMRLARIVRATPEEWAAMRPALCELFGIDWNPERLAKRRMEVESLHLKNKANGRKGARKRWNPDGEANGEANGEAISRANGEANSNHNHNHMAPAYEGKALPYTHTRARDELIPVPRSQADGQAILSNAGVFPGDFGTLLPKLMRGELSQSELDAAA